MTKNPKSKWESKLGREEKHSQFIITCLVLGTTWHFIDLGAVFHHFYDAVLGTIAVLEGEVGGEGLLSRNGSPGATNATTFSFFESQNAG